MKQEFILLAHGSGGKLMHDLIKKKIAPSLNSSLLSVLDDSCEIFIDSEKQTPRIAFTTDSYVVKPIFFPGGDIGKLAVAGTVNDLAMKGAIPLAISLAFIIEEGFPFSELEVILDSVAKTAKSAGVEIATGDTKVVERGSADKIFINTSGIGIIPGERNVSGANVKPGDVVIISGTVGDHGLAIMAEREGLGLNIPVVSDVRPLNSIIEKLFSEIPPEAIHALRDPTRGGVATTLNEISQQSNVNIVIEEEKVPIREEVLGACEILGFDPLYVANEGKFILFIDPKFAEKALSVIRAHPDGKDAEIIGYVEDSGNNNATVFALTPLGTRRFLMMLTEEQLPRIC